MSVLRSRSSIGRISVEARLPAGNCPCLDRQHSNGLCERNVWQGTMVDDAAAKSDQRLLRPNMPVVKYKDWTILNLSGPLYHLIIMPWVPLLCVFIAIYIATVSSFALMFYACDGQHFVHTSARHFFNLSLQTIATIGYGQLYPVDACANWVMVVESFVSLLLMSFTTGVAFAKFARPNPNMIFSKVFTVAERDERGDLEMRFRVVNGTRRQVASQGEILEVSFKLILMRVESGTDGSKALCYYDLDLQVSSFIVVRLEAELVHQIDDSSPFAGMSRSQIEESDFVLILMMAGVDANLHDMIHQQYEYSHANMRYGAKFAPALRWDSDRRCIILDFDQLSETVPAPFSSGEHSLIQDEADNLGGRVDESNDEVNLWPVADEHQGVELDRLHHQSVPSGLTVRTPAERRRRWQENHSISDGDMSAMTAMNQTRPPLARSGSGLSTSTNSASDDFENRSQQSTQHVRFDRRSRTTSFRLPRLTRPRAHYHDVHNSNQPDSVLRTRIEFNNHPLKFLSSGLYYRALEISWIRLVIGLIVVYYTSIVAIAALLYFVPGRVIVEVNKLQVTSEFQKIFFFCAQTISTVGYGALSPDPDDDVVNFFVFVLVVAGIIVSTLLTGIAWSKFAQPKASTLIFSDNLLITSFHGQRAIMFRAANNRTYGMIIEGSFRISVIILDPQLQRKVTHELKLERNVWPIVQLGTIVTHVIDEDSPLWNFSTDDLLSGKHFFMVLFTGLDSVIGETIYCRKTYHCCDMLVGHHFVDNIKLATDGIHIDLTAINETVLMPDADLRDSRLFAMPVRRSEPSPDSRTNSGENDEDASESVHQFDESESGMSDHSPRSDFVGMEDRLSRR